MGSGGGLLGFGVFFRSLGFLVYKEKRMQKYRLNTTLENIIYTIFSVTSFFVSKTAY